MCQSIFTGFFLSDYNITIIIVRRLGVSGAAEALQTPHSAAQLWEQTLRISQALNRVKQLLLDRRLLPLMRLCGANIATCYFAVTNRGGVYKPLFTFFPVHSAPVIIDRSNYQQMAVF